MHANLAQVGFESHQHKGRVGAMMPDLGMPRGAHVGKGGRGGDGEAHEEDVRERVGKRADACIFLLAGRVPELQPNLPTYQQAQKLKC